MEVPGDLLFSWPPPGALQLHSGTSAAPEAVGQEQKAGSCGFVLQTFSRHDTLYLGVPGIPELSTWQHSRAHMITRQLRFLFFKPQFFCYCWFFKIGFSV